MLKKAGFRSAHAECCEGAEPFFTSWSGWVDRDVRAVFDYILSRGKLNQNANLRSIRALKFPGPEAVLKYSERLPNADYPSDHFPVVAEFAIVSGKALEEPAPNDNDEAQKKGLTGKKPENDERTDSHAPTPLPAGREREEGKEPGQRKGGKGAGGGYRKGEKGTGGSFYSRAGRGSGEKGG